MESLSALSYDGTVGGEEGQMLEICPKIDVAASDVTFEPQTSLEGYSEQSQSPKAFKMDRQGLIGKSPKCNLTAIYYT